MSELENIRKNLAHDLPASLVVFLVALPLCMGIAIASGAPPAAGLITGIVGGLVVGALSGSPLQVSGPAAGLTVLVWDLIQRFGFGMLGMCIVVAGILQIVAAALGGGRWFRAISPPVVYGMLAGIGVLIFASQFHVMVDDKPQGSGLENLLSIPNAIVKGITASDTPHQTAALLGVITISTIVAWTFAKPKKLAFMPAPLVAVIVGVVVSAAMNANVKYVNVPDTLFKAPDFLNAETFAKLMQPEVWAAIIGLAVIASAETLLCAGAVDRMQDHVKANYDRELFAQGVGNALCGLLGGLPMTGVIVRSSANVESGARTRASAILHGLWLLVLVSLAPFVLRYIPTSCLAAILVYTGYKLVSPEHIRELRNWGWSSIAIFAATMSSIVVLDLLRGVALGLALSLVRLLYRLGHLEIETLTDEVAGRIEVKLRGAATFMRLPDLVRVLERLPIEREIHVHIEDLTYIDHACWVALGDWERQQIKRGGKVVLEWHRLSQRSEREPARARRAEEKLASITP